MGLLEVKTGPLDCGRLTCQPSTIKWASFIGGNIIVDDSEQGLIVFFMEKQKCSSI